MPKKSQRSQPESTRFVDLRFALVGGAIAAVTLFVVGSMTKPLTGPVAGPFILGGTVSPESIH